MFVGTGGNVMQAVVQTLIGIGGGPDKVLSAALILNVALILFGPAPLRRPQPRDLRAHRGRTARALSGRHRSADRFLNRRALIARQQLIASAVAEKRNVALFLLDLDHFKTVNDIHGHAAGDRALQVAAERITAILPPNATKARSLVATNSSR